MKAQQDTSFPLSTKRFIKGSRRLAREKCLQVLAACENSGIRWQDVFQHILFRDFQFDDGEPDTNRLLTTEQIAEIEADTTIRWEGSEVEFTRELIDATLQHAGYSETLIDRYAQNWDIERIALLDRILLRMAIAELMAFPEIPTKVTINEIIELAKRYSTDKSNVFINGVMDSVHEELKKVGSIQKSGRGLLDS